MTVRSRSKDQGFFEALFGIAAKIPWWLGVGLAVVLYFILHAMATASTPAARNVGELNSFIVSQMFRLFAAIGQYVVPLALLMGAAVSAYRRSQVPRIFSPTIQPSIEPKGFSEIEASPPQPASQRSEDHDQYEDWKDTILIGEQKASIDTSRWSLELLRALEWKRFEEVCSGLFQRLGFRTKTTRCGADGGVDIHLYKQSTDKADVIVQCKAWNSRPIGIKPMRELLGVMASTGVAEGIFVTTTNFNREAREFAKVNRIDCMDGEAVLGAIDALSQEERDSLLKMATTGDYKTPTCASCGIKLVKKWPRAVEQDLMFF